MVEYCEIRCGSLLKWKDNNQIFDVTLGLLQDENFWKHIVRGDIVGIEMTPDIFSKCGFFKGEKWHIHQVYYIGQFDICFNKNEVVYGNKTEHGFNKVSQNLKHLHLIQLAYFAVTGKEITYTP